MNPTDALARHVSAASGRTFISMLLAATLSGCSAEQGAWGEANSIIVVSDPALWANVGDSVKRSLEPRILTVRDELMFQVTYQDPASQEWTDMRRFKHLLLLGTGREPWIQDAMSTLGPPPSPPALTQVHDVWARDQLITMALLPEAGREQPVYDFLPELQRVFDQQYRAWAVNRMFLSGYDSAGAEALFSDAGFSLLLPNVYQYRTAGSVHVFRNDNPDPSELIREISVSWVDLDDAALTADSLLAWRARVVEDHYNFPQVVDLSLAEMGPAEFQGRPGYQIQAMWRNPPEEMWPAGGLFFLRAIECPAQNRLYLLDAWLYAPGDQKYEFVIQLETILDSFQCGST